MQNCLHNSYTFSENETHHFRNMGFILCALSLEEVDDDSETSCADCWVMASLVLVQVHESNNQNQCL